MTYIYFQELENGNLDMIHVIAKNNIDVVYVTLKVGQFLTLNRLKKGPLF